MRSPTRGPLCLTLTALLLGAALGAPAYAQVRQPGLPAGLSSELPTQVPNVTLEPVDVPRLLAEDEARGHRPFRYGTLLPVHKDILEHGRIDAAEDGSMVVRMGIRSPGAHSLGLEFTSFHLPEGAQLFLYDNSRLEMLGAYTSENHREDGGFVIEPFPGDHVIVEVLVPPQSSGDLRVVVGDVIHDYRDVRMIPVGGAGGEGGCLIDVNCPQGDNWSVQKRATVRTLSGGSLCSGALINNTANDGTRYLLTADHCGQGSNTIFTFNYQSSGCGTGSAPTNQTVSGATLLVTNGTVDSRLMRINSNIPASYNPAWAGWSRSTTNANFAFALGHPSGGPKKISVDGNGTSSNTNFYFVTWSEGTLEGGSSGGPLFDAQGRIRGPACCVNSFSCSQTANFGRFNRFWTLGNLAQWLDPLGTNATTLDAFAPGGSTSPAPSLAWVAPFFVLAVAPDEPYKVVLNGSDLSAVNKITVDGVQLTTLPAQYTILSNTQIEISVPRVNKIGSVVVEVTSPGGTAQLLLSVFPNPTPVIDLANSEPLFLLSALGATVTMGGNGGDVILLFGSLSNVPSSLPGIVDLGIGNNFAALLSLGTHVVNPVQGWTSVTFPLTGVAPGTTIHFQGAKFTGALPLIMSNVQSGTVLL